MQTYFIHPAQSNLSVSQRTAEVQSLWEAQGQFGNPEEGKRPPLEAVTRQRLVKTKQTEKIYYVL
jgi:hypothetical protein